MYDREEQIGNVSAAELARRLIMKMPDEFDQMFGNEERMNVAHRALIALERGKRADYLSLRQEMESHSLKIKKGSDLSFYVGKSVVLLDWMDLVHTYCSVRAIALANEVEESNWEVICEGQSRLIRMQETELNLKVAKASPKASWAKRVIDAMNFRIAQVIRTGSRKQMLITMILEMQPNLRKSFEADAAVYEQAILKSAIRKKKREDAKLQSLVGPEEIASVVPAAIFGPSFSVGRSLSAQRL